MYGLGLFDGNRSITRDVSSQNWYQEQVKALDDKKSEDMFREMSPIDIRFQETAELLREQYNGLDIMTDAERMFRNKDIMAEYKSSFLIPFLESFKNDVIEETTGIECKETHKHLQGICEQISEAWDAQTEAYKNHIIMESYNTAGYLPLATMDFPALLKQYIRFLGKDIIPVQNSSTFNIEMRIFIQKLRDNNTGQEWEIPKVYFQKEADGTSTWDKLWNVGKGIRINNRAPITREMINNARTRVFGTSGTAQELTRRFNMFQWLMNDADHPLNIAGTTLAVPTNASFGAPTGLPTAWAELGENEKQNIRTRLSYDFNIQYIQIDTEALGGDQVTFVNENSTVGDEDIADERYLTIRLPKGGIAFDLQTNGTFLNGGITLDMNLPVMQWKDGGWVTTGVMVNFSEQISGQVDFVHGTLVWSSLGIVTGVYVDGRISNETNLRTIGFREYPEIRRFTIADGCRFQLPFTIEDFANSNASLNFNLYNRMTQALIVNQELFEDQYILEYLDQQFMKYNGQDTNIWDLESYTHTEYAELNPTVYVGGAGIAVDPFDFRTNSIQNAIASVIYELADKGKMDNLGFVVYCNPKVARLLRKYVTWTIKNTTDLGGTSMNHSFGIMTDENLPIRVVASSRVPAYTEIPSTAEERLDYGVRILGISDEDELAQYSQTREYFFKIVAYPQDKFHVSYKHYRFARHMTNTPENAGYLDANNPGGSAMVINTSSRYRCISIQGIQGRVICRNSKLVPDENAGVFKPNA